MKSKWCCDLSSNRENDFQLIFLAFPAHGVNILVDKLLETVQHSATLIFPIRVDGNVKYKCSCSVPAVLEKAVIAALTEIQCWFSST